MFYYATSFVFIFTVVQRYLNHVLFAKINFKQTSKICTFLETEQKIMTSFGLFYYSFLKRIS